MFRSYTIRGAEASGHAVSSQVRPPRSAPPTSQDQLIQEGPASRRTSPALGTTQSPRPAHPRPRPTRISPTPRRHQHTGQPTKICLLYTSDAADEEDSVD